MRISDWSSDVCSSDLRTMKKLIAALATVAAFSAQAAETLTVAATAVPPAELLEFVKPQLAEQGVELNVKVFTDYVQPNIQVAEKRLDANFFQQQPYPDEFNTGTGPDQVHRYEEARRR